MKYYSTNKIALEATLSQAVIKGLAPDKGLYMPKKIETIEKSFFENIASMSLHQIACRVARAMFAEDIDSDSLDKIVCDTLNFKTPVVKVEDNVYSLELFHGPTLAFKDVGGRFMARMLSHFLKKSDDKRTVTVLVATSGDTGSAVANGFLGVEGIEVIVLYPKGKVSEIQEKQFTTLGQNITALEIDGTFDDCQNLVKNAFMDSELTSHMKLTSANSINVARFLPQAFYYFSAYSQLRKEGITDDIVVSVPSGNFGNLSAGLVAKRMGLPIKRFIAANNRNDIFLEYLKTGEYSPRASVSTIANAMDVGDPSNFVRILDLYGSAEAIRSEISGYSYDDKTISDCVAATLNKTGYLLDPHGACAYMALKKSLADGETGIFLETAHPAKFIDTVEPIIGRAVEIPARLAEFMKGEKLSIELSKDYKTFKNFLMGR